MKAESTFLTRTCPACGSDRRAAEVASGDTAETMTLDALRPYWRGLFQKKVFFTYDRCGECSLLYAPRFFDEAQLSDLYSDMAPNMDVVSTEAIEATQRVYLEEAMAGLGVSGGYVEIGPDVGYLVRDAAKSGKFDHFYLFEPNRTVHGALEAAAGDTPHTISADMTDLSIIPDRSIALAVMVHVLDHLLDPRAMLEQIRAKLKRGGRLVIVTHNERSALRRIMGTRWPPFCLQHPEIYNPDSISRLLRGAGFQSVDVRRSKNYFPIGFMMRQAAHAVGIKLDRIPLPATVVGLRLGNIMTFAEA